MSLAVRDLRPEAMDTERVPVAELARAHRDLGRLSAIGRAHAPLLAWLDRLSRGRRALSILDVGSGAGGTLRRIARWGARRGLDLRLDGVDLNPDARRIAEAATNPALPIRYHTADALALGETLQPDAVVSMHFAHHLDDGELVRFLRWMESTARLGWYVSDLHRHPVLHGFLRVAPRLLRHHRLVVSDAPISVARSFVRADWERALRAAGIPPERLDLRWHVPFRWGLGTRVPG